MFKLLINPDYDLWNSFITEQDCVCFSHRLDWPKTIGAVYDLPLFHLVLIELKSRKVVAALPLLLFAPPEEEARLISLPYTDGAGVLAVNSETAVCLLKSALAFAEEHEIPHLEIRQPHGLKNLFKKVETKNSWQYNSYDFKTGLHRELPETSEELWASFSSKVRNQVRKAQRCGCTVQLGSVELLDDFYAVFSENMRDLGSPVHSSELFRRLLECAALAGRVVMIYLEGVPVAGGIVFQHNTTLSNPWASSLRRYRPSCPNMLLYWAMLEYAMDCGCTIFDFGRSTAGAPTCRFKEQWGATREQLVWHVFSRSGHTLWDPRSESLEIEHWKSINLAQSRVEGPALRRWISL